MVETLVIVLLSVLIGMAIGAATSWWLRRPAMTVADDPVEAAVRRAYLSVGLPDDQFGPDFNLLKAGKLQDVYHRAARDLRLDPEFDTVGDVIRWLRE